MSGDDSTLTVGPVDTLTGQSGLPSVPALTIVWHPHLDRIGHIAPLTNLLEHDLAHVSRSEPVFFAPGGDAGEPLAHRFISKKPVLDVVAKAGTFELRRVQDDQVEVDGQLLVAPRRVTGDDLRRGVMITLARRVVLCLHFVHVPISRSPAFGLLGSSDGIEDVRRLVARLAPQNAPVLLRGESGTGKELAAHALHAAGPRGRGPFVALNMAQLDRSRAAADLFGHRRGSFTGATADSPGHFRAAAGGTILLDEIGYTPSEVQPMLLRVLDDQRIQSIGSSEAVKVDVRIVAATDARLEEAVTEARFERPLYNRLMSGYIINLPALRDRRQDVGVLLVHLLSREMGDASLLQRLQDPDPKVRPWLSARDVAAVAGGPLTANVRSLLGLARKLAAALGDGLYADTHAIVNGFLAGDRPKTVGQGDRPAETAAPAAARYSRELVIAALEEAGWNRRKAAEILGVGPTTFYRWLDRDPHFRQLLEVDPAELQRRLRDAAGDVTRLASDLQTSPEILARLLARRAP